jgi:hypothetical protein
MELLGDMCHVESYFGPFGHGVCVGAIWANGLRLGNHFGRTCWYC